jgi:lipid II:glycine glycyltransferase (peptidoglycan interpeptide bridge formation enzyme)
MPFLFWRTIEQAKSAGIPLMDFGRSDLENPGLIRFKDQWGTQQTELCYYRFPPPVQSQTGSNFAERAAKSVFARLPDRILAMAGRAIYRHMG